MISVIVLVPRLTNPTPPPSLLDETVTLTSDFYEKEYYLQLAKGDRLHVKVDSHGQPVDFEIIDPNGVISDKGEICIYEEDWIVPVEGVYVFYVGAKTGTPKVRITVTKL